MVTEITPETGVEIRQKNVLFHHWNIFTKVEAAPRFEKEKSGHFDFTFFGARCPHFCISFLQNSGLFKYKSRGENDALFLLTRFTSRTNSDPVQIFFKARIGPWIPVRSVFSYWYKFCQSIPRTGKRYRRYRIDKRFFASCS